jgi:putative addiction module CopG family antidote
MEAMNVSLTAELEKYVRRKVASGLYNNASEVIREALRLLVEREGAPIRRSNRESPSIPVWNFHLRNGC